MAELDPNIILKAFSTPQLDVAGLMETRDQLQNRQLVRQKVERQEAEALAAQQRRQQIGAQAATDPTGARREAIGAGDFDLVKQLDSMDEASRKRIVEVSQATAPLLMSLKEVPAEMRGQALQQMAPQLQAYGFSPEKLKEVSGDLSDGALDRIGASAMTIEQYNKMNEPYTLSPGSKRFGPGGKVIAEVGFAPRPVTVGEGQTVVEYTPGGASGGSGIGALDVESVRPHIVAQESRGNYSARNRGTGALGAYQVMPQTGKALADRLGMPWRPELMTASTADGKAYQDAIGGAAIAEAIEASGGDPNTMAQYYHGGSDRSGWGPKTRQYGEEVVARLGGGTQGGGPRVIAQGAPKAPKPGEGGPDRKAEADLRKEFNARPEVKDFKTRRQSWQTIDRLGKAQAGGEPTAQNDMALIFQYMKMLDPGSVVREGEFATAQNAAGVPDQIVNAYNKARSGELMNPQQRKNMVNSAATVYTSSRDAYNPIAQEYQAYARDYGIEPNRVAQEYKPTRAPRSGPQRPASGGWGSAKVVSN